MSSHTLNNGGGVLKQAVMRSFSNGEGLYVERRREWEDLPTLKYALAQTFTSVVILSVSSGTFSVLERIVF